MISIYDKIWNQTIPYLQHCRPGDLIHTRVSLGIMEAILECEGGDADILIPAIMLHDIGWSQCPKELVKGFFDDIRNADENKELRKQHMEAGACLSRRILEQLSWNPGNINTIVSIIAKHDIPEKMISPEEKKVFDADYAWRFTEQGFYLDLERFKLRPEEAIERLEEAKKNLKTSTGKKIAYRELTLRKKDF